MNIWRIKQGCLATELSNRVIHHTLRKSLLHGSQSYFLLLYFQTWMMNLQSPDIETTAIWHHGGRWGGNELRDQKRRTKCENENEWVWEYEFIEWPLVVVVDVWGLCLGWQEENRPQLGPIITLIYTMIQDKKQTRQCSSKNIFSW